MTDADPDWYARYRREVEAAHAEKGYVEVGRIKRYWRDDVRKRDYIEETVTKFRPYWEKVQ